MSRLPSKKQKDAYDFIKVNNLFDEWVNSPIKVIPFATKHGFNKQVKRK